MASRSQPLTLGEQLSTWAPLTVVRNGPRHARAIEIAAWVKSLPPDVTTAWVTARAAPNEFESFDAWLSDALLAAGVTTGTSAGGALGGFDELETLLSRREARVLVIVNNFDEIKDKRILERIVQLLDSNRNLHVLVCCGAEHPIQALAEGAVETKVVPTGGPTSTQDVARALTTLLDHPWSERLREELLSWRETAPGVPATAAPPPPLPDAGSRSALASSRPRDGTDKPSPSRPPPGGSGELHDPIGRFRQAAVTQDWETVDRLWFGNVAAMLSDNSELLHQTLETMPAEVLRANPSMEVMREALQTATADDDDSKAATARAFADACARLVTRRWDSMTLNELLVVGTGALIQLRLVGRFEDSEALGDRLSARTVALAATQQAARGRLGLFHLHRGVTFSLLGDDASAIRSYSRAWEQAIGGHADFVRSNAAANLALTYALNGETPLARRWLQRHRSLDTRDWPGHQRLSVGGHVAAGMLALDRLDDEAAREELRQVDGDGPSGELWPFVAFLHARLALHRGTARQALAHIEHLRAARDRDVATRGAASALMSRAQADLLIANGQGERARRVIQDAQTFKGLTSLPTARLRVLGGQVESGRYVDRLTWDPATSTRDRLEMLLIGALSALRRHDERTAARLANQAIELYGETGILSAFATIPLLELTRLLDLAEQGLGPGDLAVLAQQPAMYPERLVLVALSEREQAVLNALATMRSRQAIADALFVSVNTVKTQLASIYEKLGATSREGALRKAVERGLLPDEGA